LPLPDAHASRTDLPLASGEGARRVAASRNVWEWSLAFGRRAPRDAARTSERDRRQRAGLARVLARTPVVCRAASAWAVPTAKPCRIDGWTLLRHGARPPRRTSW